MPVTLCMLAAAAATARASPTLLVLLLLHAGAQWGASGMDVPNHPGTMQV
jgi:hypothetical protein